MKITTLGGLLCVLTALRAQPVGPLTPQAAEQRRATEKALESVAIIDRKVMVPMRDGKRMATDIYRPKDTSKKYPIIFVRTPYNFNFWDVKNGVPRDMTDEFTAVKRGYAFVEMNERGHFFSEGEYDILGAPLSDGDDAISWMAKQPWSNGKVGTIGCSSTAEWQLGVAALGNPAFAAMIPQGFGAGVGRVKPYFEQGNCYRGGAVQMLFAAWLYSQQNQVRPMFSANTSQADLIAASRLFDLAPRCRRSIGRRRCNTCPRWTLSPPSTDRAAFSPTAWKFRPEAP
jgi:putative CocE/NonD family hydrolase